MIRVRREEDRLSEAIRFTKDQIDDLNRKIHECDYVEDPSGRLVFMPGSYVDEKREYEYEKRNWEILLGILTMEAPFSMQEW